ncbi:MULTISPECIES: LacI family DNA-binding transcriptional regulator [unclassified Clostridium]|uniref:LacI family DNA-binding transcriptional regulator n=1 Tax=unclassified Clostridium TaxID=2614128 RepID=UPI0025C4F41B|nr:MULTISPECIES: LacI family DNA-binding transcriptional regulator [unclassified Clostridium]
MKVTIKDVAKKANVSITTVSRVINKIEGYTNEETKKRILKVIEELDYKPNALARSLVTKRTKTIGLILPDISNPFFPSIAKSVEDLVNELGYNLILCNSYDDTEKEANYINVLKEKCVDGILLSSKQTKDKYDIYKDDVPMVFIDRKPEVEIKYGVFVDNYKGAYNATKHLIDLGHRSIACITGPKNINTTIERLRGYKDALIDNHIECDETIIKSNDYAIEGGYEAAKDLIKNHNITAIFTHDDLMACGVYKAAKELSYKIPDDISVVGFDDITLVEFLDPPLTTIKQPTEDIGKVSVEILMDLIENNKIQGKIISLDTELIIRESTKNIK